MVHWSLTFDSSLLADGLPDATKNNVSYLLLYLMTVISLNEGMNNEVLPFLPRIGSRETDLGFPSMSNLKSNSFEGRRGRGAKPPK